MPFELAWLIDPSFARAIILPKTCSAFAVWHSRDQNSALPNTWDEIGAALTCKVGDDMCRKMDVFVSETSCLVDGWVHACAG